MPAVSEPLSFPASQVGLELALGGFIQLLPNIAGYVGADHVAVILATRLWVASQPSIAIDIGTNTKISLAVDRRLYSCSCASGSAFEGAHIHDGMCAAPGAIERVQLIHDDIRIYTIGDQPPVGICSSGILDVVAELLRNGILDENGALNPSHPRVQPSRRGPEFILVPEADTAHGRDITISRRDVNEIQLAKAAIRTGIDVLLEVAGIQALEVRDWIIAGAFGTYINLESAIRIGLFHQAPLERFRQVGNAAGIGARQVLLSRQSFNKVAQVALGVNYIELTTFEGFQQKFLRAMYL